jgi:hypothetical protein
MQRQRQSMINKQYRIGISNFTGISKTSFYYEYRQYSLLYNEYNIEELVYRPVYYAGSVVCETNLTSFCHA